MIELLAHPARSALKFTADGLVRRNVCPQARHRLPPVQLLECTSVPAVLENLLPSVDNQS